MKPKFFTDTHVDHTAIKQLNLKGVDIVRCQDVGLADAEDIDLLIYATQQGRVMVSCDQDFERLHYDYLARELEHAGILYMDQEHHCKHISEIVRIILYYYELADNEDDLAGKLWDGRKAQ